MIVEGRPCRIFRKGKGVKVGFIAPVDAITPWIPFLDELATEREVLVVSIPAEPQHDLDERLDWIIGARDVVRAAGLEGADLVASSFGASVAAEIAALWPESVRRLALIAPRVAVAAGFGRRLARIVAPTLLVWGDRDPINGADQFARCLRTAKEVRVIRCAGYPAEIDEPHESAAAILEWLRPVG